MGKVDQLRLGNEVATYVHTYVRTYYLHMYVYPMQPFKIIKKEYSMDKISPSFPAIKDALSPPNYCNKFHHLLFWEELQHIKELNKR